MKPHHQNPLFLTTRATKLLGLCTITLCVFTAGHAADVNTTGTTVILNTDNPGNRYLGNGTLEIVGDAGGTTPGVIELGNAFNTPITEFAMTGGTMTITTGTSLRNGGFSRGVWTNNASNLQLDGTLDIWDGNPPRFNSLNGSGSILTGFPFGGGSTRDVRIGVLGGGGTFSGSIADVNNGARIRVIKDGAGTQIFDNLANQKPGQLVINAGAVDLSSATAVSMPTQFFGVGNLIKSGAGALTISSTSGALMVSGTTSLTGGSLGFGSEVSARANLVAATGTTLGLNFTGQATVATLNLDGSGPLPAGLYDSTTPVYGSFFTGTGQLNVLNGALASASGTWSSTTGGFWGVSSRWTGGTIANGSDNTATIGAAAAISVTLDRDETIGNITFQGNNHTLNGAQTLTLAGTTPGVTVASGTSSRIETQIAGTAGLAKSGAGTLTLAGSNKTYTGGTAVNEGRLILANLFTGTANYSAAAGATLEFNFTGTANRVLSGGTISGAGNLVKTGDGRLLLGASGNRQNIALGSGALINVQGGVIRGEFGNSSGTPAVNGWLNNKADLNVATGAFFDIWDSNGIVDSISGSGTINKGWNANSTLTFGVDNGSGTFTGAITQGTQTYGGSAGGTFSLVKTGTGTQTLSGSNAYNGTTTINNGTLIITGTTLATTAITSTGDGKLGLDIGSTVNAPSATVTFTDRTVLVTGTPTLASYTLLTASSIIGTPTLAAPAPAGYSLVVVNNNELRLVSTGDPFLTWSGGAPFQGDENKDGVSNGLAWFLGAGDTDDNANGLLPEVDETAGALVMTFDCLDEASRGAAVFEVQYSSDLGQIDTWSGTAIPGATGTFTAGVVDFVVTAGPGPGKLSVTATIPAGEAAAGKVFGRIRGVN